MRRTKCSVAAMIQNCIEGHVVRRSWNLYCKTGMPYIAAGAANDFPRNRERSLAAEELDLFCRTNWFIGRNY